MTNLTRRAALGSIGAAALAAAGARAAAPREIRIGWQKGGVVALLKGSGALERGLADRGIAVAWSEFTSGPPLLEALGAGALDFGTTGDVPPLFAHAARGNLVFVGASSGSVESSAILVREGSPIATLKHLRGRRIAYMAMSAREFMILEVVVLSIALYALLGKLADAATRAFERRTLAWSPAHAGR